jgi:hypothetical protein
MLVGHYIFCINRLYRIELRAGGESAPNIGFIRADSSFADPDPGSEDLFDLDPESGSRMNIPDHISESLEKILWVKNT